MRLLLDTHFVSWLAINPRKIDRREQALMSRSDLLVSAISILELRIKWDKFERTRQHRNDLLDPAAAIEHIARNGWELVPVTGEDCAASLDPPLSQHRDPFDEMLLIHAQRLDARLLTRDSVLGDHPLAISA